MEYKIKTDGMFIMKKDTHFNVVGEITHIDWVAGFGIPENQAVKFNEVEKDFMIAHYKGLEVIRLA